MQTQPPIRSKLKIPIVITAVLVVIILVAGAWFVNSAISSNSASNSDESKPTQVMVVINGSFWSGTIYTNDGSTITRGTYGDHFSKTFNVTGSNFYVWVLVEAEDSYNGILAVSIHTIDGKLLAEGSAIGPHGLIDIYWTA